MRMVIHLKIICLKIIKQKVVNEKDIVINETVGKKNIEICIFFIRIK